MGGTVERELMVPEPELEAPQLDQRSRIGDVARAAFAASVERLIGQDAALRLHPDADPVHDARVSVRRLRSDLRTFLPILDATWARDLRERLRWLQDGFSAARDADVLLASVRRHAEALPEAERRSVDDTVAPLRDERGSAYARMGEMLHDPRYASLLQELVDAVKRPPFGTGAGDLACDAIGGVMSDAWSALRKRVRKRSRPPADRELHGIRIAAKRVRYAAEAVAPVAGPRARTLAHAVEQLQTVLGEQHDAVVARERMRALGADPQRAFVAGALSALEHLAATEGRRAWREPWRDAKHAHRALRRAL